MEGREREPAAGVDEAVGQVAGNATEGKTMKMLVLIILGTALVGAFVVVRTDPPRQSLPAPQVSAPAPDKVTAEDLALQPQREAFIQKMIAAKVFTKVETPGTLPHLWVGPAFHLATFDEKQKFVSVVYVYCNTQDKRFDAVVVKDSTDGKEIGVYSKVYAGLKMY